MPVVTLRATQYQQVRADIHELPGTVKWIEDRVENLVGAAHAREEKITVKVAVDDDGVLLAADVEHIEDVGAYPHGSTEVDEERAQYARYLSSFAGEAH